MSCSRPFLLFFLLLCGAFVWAEEPLVRWSVAWKAGEISGNLVRGVFPTADGKRIVAFPGVGLPVKVMDAGTGQVIQEVPAPTGEWVSALGLDAKHLALFTFRSPRPTGQVMDLNKTPLGLTPLQATTGAKDPEDRFLCFSPEGLMILDSTKMLWRTRETTWTTARVHTRGGDWVVSSVPSPNLEKGSLVIRNISDGSVHKRLELPTSITTLACHPDGSRLYSLSITGNFTIWNTDSWEIIHTSRPFSNVFPLGGMAISPDGKRIALSSASDPRILLLGARNFKTLGSTVLNHPSMPVDLAFSKDGKTLFAFTFHKSSERVLFAFDRKVLETCTELPSKRLSRTVGADLTNIAFSPDGNWLAARSERKLRWCPWKPPYDAWKSLPDVEQFVFSKDSRHAFAWQNSRLVKIRLDTGEVVVTGPAGVIYSNLFALSPEGRQVAYLDAEKRPRLLSSDTLQEERALEAGPKRRCDVLFWSKDGRTLVGSSFTQTTLWDLPSGKIQRMLAVGQARVMGGNDTFLIGKGSGDRLFSMDLDTGAPREPFPESISVNLLAADCVGERCAGMRGSPLHPTEGAMLYVWEKLGGYPSQALFLPEPLHALAFHPDGRTLVGADKGGLWCWNLPPLVKKTIRESTRKATWDAIWRTGECLFSLKISPDSKHFAVRALDGLRIFGMESERALFALDEQIFGLDFTPSNELLFASQPSYAGGSAPKPILSAKLWSPEKGIVSAPSFMMPADLKAFHLVGNYLLISRESEKSGKPASEANIELRKWPTGKVLREIENPWSGIGRDGFTLSPQGRFAFNDGYSAQFRVWGAEASEDRSNPWVNLKGRELALDSSDRRVAFGVDPVKGLALWKLDEKPAVERYLPGPTTEGNAAAFSPDGRYVACGEENGRIWLWDLSKPGPGHLLEGHFQYISSLVFQGAYLFSASHDGTVRRWKMPL